MHIISENCLSNPKRNSSYMNSWCMIHHFNAMAVRNFCKPQMVIPIISPPEMVFSMLIVHSFDGEHMYLALRIKF